MKFTQWLFNKSPKDTDEAPVTPFTMPAVPVADDSEMIAVHTPVFDNQGDEEITLDEMFTGIEYTDSKGIDSSRRITVLKIVSGPTAPILRAICHERKAMRSFRTDRISSFIDVLTGEVSTPQNFFEEYCGVQIVHQPIAEDPKPNLRIAFDRFRRMLRAPLGVLVAVSKCDGMRDTEVDVILEFIETELIELSKIDEGIAMIPFPKVATLEGTVRKMRPRAASLVEHMKEMSKFDNERFNRFANALRRVICADNRISEEEVQIFQVLLELDAGIEIFNTFDLNMS